MPMAVEVRRRDAGSDERGELRLALAAHVGRIDLAGKRTARQHVERMEPSGVGIHQRWNGGERCAGHEVEMQPDAQPGSVTKRLLRRLTERGAAHHHRGGAHRARGVGLEDPAVHALRETEVVGVDDEKAHGGGMYGGAPRWRLRDSPSSQLSAVQAPCCPATSVFRDMAGTPCGGVWIPGTQRSSLGKTKRALVAAAYWPRQALVRTCQMS